MSTKSYLQHIYSAYATSEPTKFNPFKPSFYFDEEGDKVNFSKRGYPCKSTSLKFFSLTKWKEYELGLLHYYYREALIYFNERLWGALGFNNDVITEDQITKSYSTYPYVEYGINDPETPLSSRMLSQVRRQSLAMVNSTREKVGQLITIKNWLIKQGRAYSFKQEQIDKTIKELTLPKVPDRINMEIDLKNADIILAKDKKCDYVLVIRSIWNEKFRNIIRKSYLLNALGKRIRKDRNEIFIPLNSHRYNNLLNNYSKFRANSFLIHQNKVDVRYYYEKPTWTDNKKRKVIAAGDQGANKPLVIADSEGNIYLPCERLDNFCELLHKKTRMQHGSKNFSDMKKNITNTINAVINQLVLNVDFTRLSVFYLEDIRYMGKGTYAGRLLKGFVHGQIRKKLQSICDLYGVQLKLSPNRYKSQRCSQCGFTHKKNRKNQAEFKCCSCGYEGNADVNSCRNHLDRGLIGIRKVMKESRTTGFFWNKKQIVICEEFAVKPKKRVRKQKENASLTVM